MSDAAAPPPAGMIYREDQQYRQPYHWVLLLFAASVIIGTVVWMIVRQVARGEAFAPGWLPDWALIGAGAVIILIVLAQLALLAAQRLQIEVNQLGLFVRLYPRQLKVRKIDLNGAEAVCAVTFRPYRDYGGHGLRGTRRARAYSISGNQGVRIDYDNGCHLLLGTQHPKTLAAAIRGLLDAVDRMDELD